MTLWGVRAPIWVALAASAALVAAVVALSVGGGPADEVPRVAAGPERARARAPAGSSGALPGPAPRTRVAAVEPTPEGVEPLAELGSAAPEPELVREDARNASLVGLEREAARLVEASDLAADVEARVEALEPLPGETADAFERRSEALRERLGSESFLLARRLRDLFAGVVYPLGFPVEAVVAQERGWIEALPLEDREVMLRMALDEREDRDLERAEPQYEGFETAGDDAAPEL